MIYVEGVELIRIQRPGGHPVYELPRTRARCQSRGQTLASEPSDGGRWNSGEGFWKRTVDTAATVCQPRLANDLL